MIIDTHIHLPQNIKKYKAKQIVREAAQSGINVLIVSDLGNWDYYPEKKTTREANDRAKEFASYDKERIMWQAYLNPQLDNCNDELERCISGGACGIKLWMSLKNSNGSLDNAAKTLNLAAKHKLPALLHVFSRTDLNEPGEITIQEFIKLSDMAPECVMIAAHAGGNWRNIMGMIRDCRRGVYMDISGGYPEQGMLEALVKSDGADRILFGSDALGRSFHSQVSKVILSELNTNTRDKILWKNAAKIYKIESIPQLSPSNTSQTSMPDLPELSEDHFCFCGNLPFSSAKYKDPKKLETLFQVNKIKSAFVGNLETIFNLDIIIANRNFLKACGQLDIIKPLGTLNPVSCNWRHQIKDITSNPYAGAIISPYLHNWQINSPEFEDFFNCCANCNIKLWINCALGEYRFRHKSFSPRNVKLDELIAFMENAPGKYYVFQGVNAVALKELLKIFNNDGRFYFDISHVTDGQFYLREIIEEFGSKRLVAGSEFPLRHLSQTSQTALNLLLR